MTNSSGSKLQSIQILRAIAAAVVLICHLQKEIRNTIGETWLDLTNIEVVGQAGVDLFFVVSGFIMVYVTKNLPNNGVSAIDFMTKRIFRVVPLYWLLTFLTLGVSLVEPSVKNHNHLDLSYTIGSFLFIPFPREDGHFTPMLGVGWTLNYEMMFYLLFCIVILMRPTFRLATFVGLLVGLSLLGTIVPTSMPQVWYWTRPIILEFLAGGLIAHAFIRGYSMPPAFGWIAIIAGLAILVWSGTLPDPAEYSTRFWAWGIPAALIVAGIVLSRRSIFDGLPKGLANLLERAGDGSYSLYLVHMFVIRITTLVMSKLDLGPMPYTLVCYVVVLIGSFILADILYRTVEIPISKLSRRFLIVKR